MSRFMGRPSLLGLIRLMSTTARPPSTCYKGVARNFTPLSYFRGQYDGLEKGSRLPDTSVTLNGRITRKHDVSNKLVFYDITSDGCRVQVMSNLKNLEGAQDVETFRQIHGGLKRGDIIAVSGFPAKSKVGELSIVPKQLDLLVPCRHTLPENDTLKDPDIRYRQRHLDLLVNKQSRSVFEVRSQIIKSLRSFLDSKGFLEVETPVLSAKAGGAIAKPFTTRSNALGQETDLCLRIAPELYLKQLVIGGFDRVYEIGKQFRNEGISPLHNPEFTTCEYYQAYSDYQDSMLMTQELLRSLVAGVSDDLILPHESRGPINLADEFRKISIVECLEAETGTEFPTEYESSEAQAFLEEVCRKNGVRVDKPKTPARLMDGLISHFIEPMCHQPTFLMDHPICLSPLAKRHEDKPWLAERFELVIAGREICNAYSELNDPEDQRSRFAAQMKDRHLGDDEAQVPDDEFCDALEYGLPPTSGWGMGIDRFVMLATQAPSIRDVIFFPALKQKAPTGRTHE